MNFTIATHLQKRKPNCLVVIWALLMLIPCMVKAQGGWQAPNLRVPDKAENDPVFRRHQIAEWILIVESAHTKEIKDRESPVLLALWGLGELKAMEAAPLLAENLDCQVTFGILNASFPQYEAMFPATGSLEKIGKSTRPLIIEAVASKTRSKEFQSSAIIVLRNLTDPTTNFPTVYFISKSSEVYDVKAKRLRQWAEKLPYGEMPTPAMLQAELIPTPEIKPAPNFANEAEREAAITRLARIFELKDILTAKDVQWAQDEERQKVFAALDELIQLNALGKGEAGKEMAQMLDFMFAPTPPEPPWPSSIFEENSAFPDEKPSVPPHPIKPLVFPTVPQGSTKTETYFPAVPKLIAMGPRIAPFIIEAIGEKNSLQFAQNATYTLRRILGSDEAIKKLLLEHAELNEKKAQRLRELRDLIPQS